MKIILIVENLERSVKIILIMENLEIILIMSGPVLLVVGNVGTLFMEEYFRHEAKFEIWHGKVTIDVVALLEANKCEESFGQYFFGGEEMTFMRYAVLSTWLSTRVW